MGPFDDGDIEGVEVRRLTRHDDDRGWLCELFRADEASERVRPVMGYASVTRPGVTRGPHEHMDQTDWFCFFGPSDFLLVMWDNRPSSATYRRRMKVMVGQSDPSAVIVPEGVVHGYRNVGDVDGMVVNLPNRLYRGEGRQDGVDEIRHETDPGTEFVM
jgi:dTDP-4-dehydrorhamnose 3,5-epimerase